MWLLKVLLLPVMCLDTAVMNVVNYGIPVEIDIEGWSVTIRKILQFGEPWPVYSIFLRINGSVISALYGLEIDGWLYRCRRRP